MMDPFNDEYFMKQALVEACSAAEEGEVPVGAVIVCNNQIIARAHNQTERLNDPTAHAEMLAITAAVILLTARPIPAQSSGILTYCESSMNSDVKKTAKNPADR